MSFAASADDQSFQEKLKFSEIIAHGKPYPKVSSLIDLKYLKNIEKCQDMVRKELPHIEFELYHAVMLDYPEFLTIALLRNERYFSSETSENPSVGGRCDFSKASDKAYLTYDDEASPLLFNFELQARK